MTTQDYTDSFTCSGDEEGEAAHGSDAKVPCTNFNRLALESDPGLPANLCAWGRRLTATAVDRLRCNLATDVLFWATIFTGSDVVHYAMECICKLLNVGLGISISFVYVRRSLLRAKPLPHNTF